MYKNLHILMINEKVTDEHIANELKLTIKAVRYRLSGETEFKRNEMLIIKKRLFPNYTLDQLFDDDVKIIDKK